MPIKNIDWNNFTTDLPHWSLCTTRKRYLHLLYGTKAVARRCSTKKVFSKFSQYLQESTWLESLFNEILGLHILRIKKDSSSLKGKTLGQSFFYIEHWENKIEFLLNEKAKSM